MSFLIFSTKELIPKQDIVTTLCSPVQTHQSFADPTGHCYCRCGSWSVSWLITINYVDSTHSRDRPAPAAGTVLICINQQSTPHLATQQPNMDTDVEYLVLKRFFTPFRFLSFIYFYILEKLILASLRMFIVGKFFTKIQEQRATHHLPSHSANFVLSRT